MMSLIYFILIITVLVFFHELGHYMAARSVGVRVEKFYIGFNLFGLGLKKMYNGTEYGLGLFPFGGYVKVAGVIDESLDDSSDNVINEDDYRSKNTFQKVWIMSAGVIMNVLVAVFVFAGFAITLGEDDGLKILSVSMKNPPAASIGIEPGDSILSINGFSVSDHMSLVQELNSLDSAILDMVSISYRDSSANIIQNRFMSLSDDRRIGVIVDSIDFVVRTVISNPFIGSEIHEGQVISSINGKRVRSKWDLDRDMALDYKEIDVGSTKVAVNNTIGIVPITYFLTLEVARGDRLGPVRAIIYGLDNTAKILKKIISGISSLNKENIGGPVMIAQMSGEVAKQGGLEGILFFMAMLSLNLAILNILPIPGLDGFHAVIALVEGMIGREISKEWKVRIQVAGMIFLLSIFTFVLWNDISRIFSN